ncbi:MAG: DUF1549 domain-containing protein, partial [Planctomycetes bacterium]|nr:DUF1549 domain-containing protein [Planctomycetota bacterium]
MNAAIDSGRITPSLLASLGVFAVVGVAALAEDRPQTAAATVDYATQIKPIFKARCVSCHGVLQQQANLRLDTAAAMRSGGDSGAAVVPGDLGRSLLVERVSASEAAERMPPEGEPLTAGEIELLRRWIKAGAPSPANEQPERDPREHWAFRKLIRPAVPAHHSSDARGNPIDGFVDRSLVQHGLTPRPPAEKHVLIRRVYLDLIGLPPTRDELLAFLADDSPDAYLRVVERLLADPRHGERWGRHWMDVWRYSDWFGRRHVPDVWNSAPQIWRWRDWIVHSLNEDRGYDRMLREMLAADEIRPEDAEAA